MYGNEWVEIVDEETGEFYEPPEKMAFGPSREAWLRASAHIFLLERGWSAVDRPDWLGFLPDDMPVIWVNTGPPELRPWRAEPFSRGHAIER
jgi:hypothetical protein